MSADLRAHGPARLHAPVLLNRVVELSARLRATRSRTAKTAAVAELLAGLAPEERRTVVAWMSGELRQGRIGISGRRAYAFAKNVTPAATPSLEVDEVDGVLDRVRDTTGAGSVAARERMVGGLLERATSGEQEFLVALLSGGLRQGALEGIVIEGVARAAELPSAVVRRAAMLSGDLPEVACLAASGGRPALEAIELRLFVPVLPMLAQTADDPAAALAKNRPLAFEEKLDGMRLQLHREGERVELYSRTLRRLTPSLPEVVALARGLPVDRVILDGEILRYDADGRPQGFGATMERFGRESDAPLIDPGAFPEVTPVFFDCLMAHGVSLIDRPETERWAALEAIVPSTNRVRRLVTDDEGTASAFLEETLARGHEGAVAKSPASTYAAGSRGAHWFKIKPAHTLDVVVLAAEWGSGRRRGFLSNLHLGVRDASGGGYAMLGKTFKGMTDDDLAWQTERLLALETRREAHVVHVRPELVVEVAFDELLTSRRYDSRLAFRFARVLRYRPDKTVDQVDTLDTARAIKERRIRARVGAARRSG